MNFKKLTYLCMQQLTNFPYIEEDFDALTNYELLCKVVEYLNKVIANENNQNEAIEELATSFTELKNYVDNLDLQEEVNNKLDEMYESGQLADLIAQYLGLAGMITFDTVADMKNAQNLVNGSKCTVLGYHSVNDGGKATYKVRTVTNEDIIDEGSIIALYDNSLVAELIPEHIVPEMFGAYGDGTHNDLTALTNCQNYCITKNIIMYGHTDSVYGVNDTFTILTGTSIDFCNATIKALTTMDHVVEHYKRKQDISTTGVYSEYTKNMVIECDSKADDGFYQNILGWSVLVDNIRVMNPKEVGININAGQIRLHNSKVDNLTTDECIGLRVNTTDSEFYNIVTRDCKIGIQALKSGNGFYECHPVMFKPELLEGSIAFDLYAWTVLIHPIIDTFEYGIYFHHAGGASIISPLMAVNLDHYNTETMTGHSPYFLYYLNGNEASNRTYICACHIPNSEIVDNEYCYFSNIIEWRGCSLQQNNPDIPYYNVQGLPKELTQANEIISLSSYVKEGYTASPAQLYNNGNMAELRITVTLPAIAQSGNRTMIEGIPTKYMPSYTRSNYVTSKNGVVCLITIGLNGNIGITAISDAIVSGDEIAFTHCYMK